MDELKTWFVVDLNLNFTFIDKWSEQLRGWMHHMLLFE